MTETPDNNTEQKGNTMPNPKEMSTAKLLDFANKDIPYKDDGERDAQNDAKNEIEKRWPFVYEKRMIDSLNRKVRDLERRIKLLENHHHDSNTGEPMVHIKASGSDSW